MATEDGSNLTRVVFEIEQLGDTVVLTPTEDMGELNAELVARGLRQMRDRLRGASYQYVVLDFERTKYFGSTALNELVLFWQEVCHRKGQMVLCGLSPHEREIVKATGLDRYWSIYTSREEAIAKVTASSRL